MPKFPKKLVRGSQSLAAISLVANQQFSGVIHSLKHSSPILDSHEQSSGSPHSLFEVSCQPLQALTCNLVGLDHTAERCLDDSLVGSQQDVSSIAFDVSPGQLIKPTQLEKIVEVALVVGDGRHLATRTTSL